MNKLPIRKNSVQETLVIPLYARKLCSDSFPKLFYDPDAKRIINMLDYDFSEKGAQFESAIGLFGAIEAAQRQYDLRAEIRRYLKTHDSAAVVNLGCGLDSTFGTIDNHYCRGYNIDLPEVIRVRNRLLPAKDREQNIPCDLMDFTWMDNISPKNGAIFYAAGVFYYFQEEDVKRLFCKIAERFPGAVIVFDSCGKAGVKMMMKGIVERVGIKNVDAPFAVGRLSKLRGWSDRLESVTSRGYMTGYRKLGHEVRLLYRILGVLGDKLIGMKIVRITVKE